MEGESCQRCADVWYDDGTVVLRAENTLFKVYRGVLQEQSLFFKDLFTLPWQESDQSEKYEECPLVTLYDHVADVRNFLRAVFDPKFYYNVKSITDCNVIVSVVKLSDKYQVEHLLRRSLLAFTVNYPATLKNWDSRNGRRQYQRLAAAYGKALPIFIIQIARTTGMDILLPSAFFECCNLSIEEILNGVLTPGDKLLCLELHDQNMILQARERLSHLAHTKLVSILQSEDTMERLEVTEWSTFLRLCALWRRAWQWMQGVEESGGWVNPLTIPFPVGDSKASTPSQRTGYTVKQRFRNARQEIWNELPAIFDLPPWDKLKRESLGN